MSAKKQSTNPTIFQPEEPIRMDIAAKIAFPDGTMGVAGLRKERDRGRLVTEMIAGKEYVTLAEIQRMRERCRVHRKAPDLSGDEKAGRRMGISETLPDGTSRTEESDSALAAAKMAAWKLIKNSQPTSPPSTPPRDTGTVVQIRSK
ncbi:excisionase [Flavimaribacter sediminis]|uniref:excisionase n=1 Tax=Flavimaribacter sediminis TaxID=2865987 RepID=UPI00215D9B6A|nr:excisionase [Flavimaribacter sediminis]